MCKILVCYPKVHMIFDILNLNTILSVLFLDTRHQENPKNRGTGNPYPNQNMTWTEMRRMAFQCRQWYRMDLWEPLMEHRGAPAANISVATEGLRVLWGFPWLLLVFTDPWWRLILCSLRINKLFTLTIQMTMMRILCAPPCENTKRDTGDPISLPVKIHRPK